MNMKFREFRRGFHKREGLEKERERESKWMSECVKMMVCEDIV